MEAEGLVSLFPIADIAVMGILPVLDRLPKLLERIRQTADFVVAARPDALVIIDSPDFTHRVARRVREVLPNLPIVNYVSPSVWAWRPGRAKAMGAYVDCVLALLPFEPDASSPRRPALRLCRPSARRAARRIASERGRGAPPGGGAADRRGAAGSRRSEIRRLMDVFGGRSGVSASDQPFIPVLPTCTCRGGRAGAARWLQAPRCAGRRKNWRRCAPRAALAAWGPSLELALAGRRGRRLRGRARGGRLKYLIRFPRPAPQSHSRRKLDHEKLQKDCNPEALAAALAAVARDGPARQAQIEALARLDSLMRLEDGAAPSAHAARAVLETIACAAAGEGPRREAPARSTPRPGTGNFCPAIARRGQSVTRSGEGTRCAIFLVHRLLRNSGRRRRCHHSATGLTMFPTVPSTKGFVWAPRQAPTIFIPHGGGPCFWMEFPPPFGPHA